MTAGIQLANIKPLGNYRRATGFANAGDSGKEHNLSNGEVDTILVIEDEPVLMQQLTSSLSQAVFNVVGVTNYLEALLGMDDFKPDLVIMDEDLPLDDGWEACYQLHRAFGLPVILLGVNYGGDIWLRALEAGADFYLRIPFSSLELTARARAIIRRYKNTRVVSRQV